MFKLFKRKYNNYDKLYNLFLDNIDNLSAARLRGIDMSFAIFKDKMKSIGYEATEVYLKSSNSTIKRNQIGFYSLETKALFSEDDYLAYMNSLKIIKKYKSDLLRINELLKEKEIIMNGYYNVKSTKYKKSDLEEISLKLGYKEKRENEIVEQNPIHPSEEFKNLLTLTEEVNKTKDYINLIKKILKLMNPYLLDDYEISPKYINDKYDLGFDSSYGVLIKNKNNGEIKMLYEVDGLDVRKEEFTNYFKENNPYIEIYLRLIIKCIKKKIM